MSIKKSGSCGILAGEVSCFC